MNLKKTIVGGAIGFAAGCGMGLIRTGITLTCPLLWIPGDAVVAGLITHHLTDGNIPATIAASAGGAAFGVGEVLAYPVTAPVSLAYAACMPAIGAVVGMAVANQ